MKRVFLDSSALVEWPRVTPETLAELETFLPTLFNGLRTALDRRRPLP